jgi:dTMP kinase
VAAVYERLMLIDYFQQTFFRVTIPLCRGKTIICDRYIYDIVIDIACDLEYPIEKMTDLLAYSFKYIMKPDITFLIDIPESIAFNRKDDTPSIAHLLERRKHYKGLANNNKMYVLDGTYNIDVLHNQVLEFIESVITRPIMS